MEDGKGRLTSGTRMVGTKKSLGQHWLKNRKILEEIAELAGGGIDVGASEITEKTAVETCLEIGPGLGTLTSSLFRRFNKVIAVEYDERLAENLPKSFPGKNLEVICGDILEYDFERIKEPYVVAGNIPYYITSPIIEKLLTTENLPVRVVLLMQKEVAERIVSEKETMLSLFVKNRAKVELGPVVLRDEFTPSPKVDSQVLVLEPHAPELDEAVFKIIQQAFRAPRKKLVHNLAGMKSREEMMGILKSLGINEDVRPGDLHLSEYKKLYDIM